MNKSNWRQVLPVLAVLLVAIACRSSDRVSITRKRDGQELSHYRLFSATGTRNADKLNSQVVFRAPDSTLTLQMQFTIGVPTRLLAGTYTWKQGNETTMGFVRANSVTFLGGQDGPPSLGGTFQLVSEDISLYDVRLPTTALRISTGGVGDPATR